MKRYFKNIEPGHGTIASELDTHRERSNKSEEFKEAKRLLKELGGNFLILRESKIQGVSTPDVLRNKTEYIEIKHPDSIVALDTRLRQGIMQLLYEKNRIEHYSLKVLILVLGKRIQNTSELKIKEIINRRLREVWKNETDLIIVRGRNNTFKIFP